jgi:hypothetical protein
MPASGSCKAAFIRNDGAASYSAAFEDVLMVRPVQPTEHEQHWGMQCKLLT